MNRNHSLLSPFGKIQIRSTGILAAFFGVILLSACYEKKQVVPEVEAAFTILTAISPTGAGVVEQFKLGCYASEQSKPYCGWEIDSTLHTVRTEANFIHDYLMQWNWTVGCTMGQADSVWMTFSSQGFCENQRLRTTDVSDGELLVAGLQADDTFYKVSGSIVRVGTQSMKVRSKMNFTSAITFTFTDIFMTKGNKIEPAGGTVKVRITGSKGSEGDFEYNGNMIFNGNKTVTLILDSKEAYTGKW